DPIECERALLPALPFGVVSGRPEAWALRAGSANRAVSARRARRRPWHGSAKEVVLHNRPERAKAVAPADLLSLGVRAAVVADADLVNDHVELGDFCRDLRLESEPILLDLDLLEHLAAEQLVARFHVREVD